MKFSVLYQDENLLAINKPPGFHVHPPENHDARVPRSKIILHQIRDQIGQKVFPVHRLDVATSGVLLFSLNSESAGKIGRQFQSHQIKKKYWAVVRGFTPDEGSIDISLESDSTDSLQTCRTDFQTLKKIELPYQVGKKYSTARYSLLTVEPHTGRFHQIRRHMNRISHPILGDCDHGDSHHNRFFRETMGIRGLCLLAHEITLTCPTLNIPLTITSGLSKRWEKILSLFK